MLSGRIFWQSFVTKPLPQTLFSSWNQVKPLIWVSAGTCTMLEQLLLSEDWCIPGFSLHTLTADSVSQQVFLARRIIGAGGNDWFKRACIKQLFKPQHFQFLSGSGHAPHLSWGHQNLAQVITNLPICQHQTRKGIYASLALRCSQSVFLCQKSGFASQITEPLGSPKDVIPTGHKEKLASGSDKRKDSSHTSP